MGLSAGLEWTVTHMSHSVTRTAVLASHILICTRRMVTLKENYGCCACACAYECVFGRQGKRDRDRETKTTHSALDCMSLLELCMHKLHH